MMRYLLAVLAVFVALFLGIQIGAGRDFPVIGALHHVLVPDALQIQDDQVRDLIERSYYKPLKGARLRDASINGMIKSLKDPFSTYFPPHENKLFEQARLGNYSGVGMTINGQKRGLIVLKTFPGSPARVSGIKPGDLITRVNSKSIVGEKADLAVARIKGPIGTYVTLTVTAAPHRAKSKAGPPRDIRLRRASIETPVTVGKIVRRGGKRYGVVYLGTFLSDNADQAVRRDVTYLINHGARGLVLDLRANGGGQLGQAVKVSSLFVKDGVIVSTDGRKQPHTVFKAIGNPVAPKIPLVVLVDRNSASASEITAGALQDLHRAKIVGTRTFGKGVFQEVTELESGGALSLTVGEYLLPSGRSINKKGVQPDVRARDLPATRRDEALDKAFQTLSTQIR